MQPPSQAMSDNSRDVATVSKRVKQTKREIEQLKSELQKLISVNLKADSHGGPAEEPPKPPATKSSPALLTVETELPVRRQKSPAARSATSLSRAAPGSLGARSKSREKEPAKTTSPPKKRSYDVAEAREYIKKQRVKQHAEQSKKTNTAANALELKKQRLKELQARSRELVTKNVELKKERMKSTERGEVQIDHGGNLRAISNSKIAPAPHRSRSRHRVQVPAKENQAMGHFPLKNVTVRQHLDVPVLEPLKKSFLPAELTNDLLNVQVKREHLPETRTEKAEEPILGKSRAGSEASPRVESVESVEHSKKAPVEALQQPKVLKDTQTQTQDKPQTPIWLQPQHQSYPYNFINTVKKKLQFAMNTPGNYVDVSTQIDASEVKSKSRAELKEILLKSPVKYQDYSFQSFASHKPPNLDLRTVDGLELVPKPASSSRVRLFENNSESDTSKNIPDLSSESDNKALSLDKVLNLRLEPQSYSSDFVNTETVPSRRSSRASSRKSSVKEASSTLVTYEDINKKTFQKSAAESRTSVSGSDIPERDFGASPTLTETSKNLLNLGSKTATVSEVSEEPKTVSETPLTTLSRTSNKQSSPDEVQSLKEPSISLVLRNPSQNLIVDQIKNITVRRGEKSKNSVHEVHLKFEAEVHLLNDFNESLKQFMAVERAFEDLKSKDGQVVTTKVLQNVDTQTSVMTRTSTTSIISTTGKGEQNSRRNASINYSRGSEIIEKMSTGDNNATVDCENLTNLLNDADSTVGWDSEVSIKDDSQLVFSLSNIENYNVNNVAGLSYNMFEQLIKDEDRRIEHLKDIIKIREQALLDRTRTELVWLDIQRKQLLETGRIEEASLVKRKQRGIIVKREQERNEIKKLDQMQKRASRERKIILKQQQNLIKSQLSTETMMSKIKVTTSRTSKERRQSGPLRVVQSCSESSFSKFSSGSEDPLNVSASQFMLGQPNDEEAWKKVGKLSNMKKTLYMREAALQKRRKAAEELLQWHRKLLDEERKISELEAAASTVIKKGKTPQEEPLKFKGKQLNGLWRTMTGREDRKFNDDELYAMSRSTLEKFCKSAQSHKTKLSSAENKSSASAYSSAFEADEPVASGRSTGISSISELMDNLSKIEDEISMLSKKSSEDLLTLSDVKTQVSTSRVPTEFAIGSVASAKDSTSADETSLSKEPSSATDLGTKPPVPLHSALQAPVPTHSIAKDSIESSSGQDLSLSSESSSKHSTAASNELSSVKELGSSSTPKVSSDLNLTPLDSFKADVSIKSSIKDLSNLTEGQDPFLEDEPSGKAPISAAPISNKLEESSDVVDKIQPIDLSELIEEVKSSIKEQESDFNSSISEAIFSKISEAPMVASAANSIGSRTKVSIEEKADQDDSGKISSAVSIPQETASPISEVLKLESSEEKTEGGKDLILKISEGVESRGIEGSDSDSRKAEGLTKLKIKDVKSSSLETEDLKSSSVKTEDPVKSSSVKTEDAIKSSSVKTEDAVKSSSVKSEDFVKSSSVKTEDSVKSSSVKTEDPVKSSSVKTEDAIKSSSVKTEDAVKSSSVKTGDSVKSSSVKTGDSVKSSSVKSEDSVKSSSEESEHPDVKIKSPSDEETGSINKSKAETEQSDQSKSKAANSKSKMNKDVNGDSITKSDKSTSKKSEQDLIKTESSEVVTGQSEGIKSETTTEPSAKSEDLIKSERLSSESSVKFGKAGAIDDYPQGGSVESEKSESSHKSSSKKVQTSNKISTETPQSSIGKTEPSETSDWKAPDRDISTAKTSEDVNEASLAISGDQHAKEKNESSKKTDVSSEDQSLKTEDRSLKTEEQSMKSKDRSSKAKDPSMKAEDQSLKTEDQISKDRKSLKEDASKTTSSRSEQPSSNKEIESPQKQDAGSSKKDKKSSGGGGEVSEEISEEISEDIESASTLHHLASDELSLDKSLEEKLVGPEKSISSDEKTPSPPSKKIDVKKRVSEILADATGLSRGADKSPRLQDLYVTAYDVPSLDLAGSPERLPPSILGHEAEELLKKQLAIEQEIKQLELQQKAQAALVFMREIPNKPPPPYKPPVSMRPPTSVLPLQRKDISDVASYSSKVLFKAHESNKIDNAKFSENSFKLITNRYIDKSCCEFLFNICKELAKEHYRQFENVPEPSWMYLPNKTHSRPLDIDGLDRYFNVKLKEMFGFKTVKINESSIVQWGRKKRDHVDEILVEELLAQEAEWTTFDRDELIVKDEVTNDIMKLLVEETADLLGAIMKKKGCLY